MSRCVCVKFSPTFDTSRHVYTVLMMLCGLEATQPPGSVVRRDADGIPCISSFHLDGPFGMRALSCLSQPHPWPALVHFIESRWVGRRICTVGQCGKTILDYAIMHGSLEIAKRLAGHMRLTCTPEWWGNGVVGRLFLAVAQCRVEIMKWLLAEEPTHPNVRCRQPFEGGRTLLHYAMNSKEIEHDPPMTREACDTRGVAMCGLLYVPGTGALNVQDVLGYSVVSCAVRDGSGALWQWLLCRREECDFSVHTFDGSNLLHLAVLAGNMRALRWLLKNTQIDPDDQNTDDRTPLHYAVSRKSVAMCELLASRSGCAALVDDLLVITDRGTLYRAIANDDLPMVLWLRDYYTERGYVDIFQRSVLYTAAARCRTLGQVVFHWLCVNYKEHNQLLCGVSTLDDPGVSVNTRLMCCYYDPDSSDRDRVCRNRLAHTHCCIGLGAIAMETRLNSWRHDTVHLLGCFVPPLCIRGIIMDYATCVDQFLPA